MPEMTKLYVYFKVASNRVDRIPQSQVQTGLCKNNEIHWPITAFT